MNQKTTKLVIVSLFSLLLLSCVSEQTLAIGGGVIPSQIQIPSALRGGEYKKSIRLVNGANISTLFILDASAEIRTWVSFYEDFNLTKSVQNITLPANTKKGIYVKFTIPTTAANGEHTGKIYADALFGDRQNNSVPLRLRFPVQILMIITGDQIVDGEVNELSISNVETGRPLTISIDFSNRGNVVAQPLIKVNITREGFPIDGFTYNQDYIDVDSGKFIYVTWDTTNREPGTYVASVTTLLEDKMIDTRNLTFQILPRGSVTRKGELLNLTYNGTLAIDNTIKIFGEFRNTGLIETEAKLILEIYRDDKFIDTLESEEILVARGNKFTFTNYLKITEAGKYNIRGYVTYETNKTAIKTLSFEVGGALESIIPIGLSVGGAIAGIGVMFFLIKNGKIKIPRNKKIAVCSKCKTRVSVNGKKGQKLAVVCPNCGDKCIIKSVDTKNRKVNMTKIPDKKPTFSVLSTLNKIKRMRIRHKSSLEKIKDR